MPVAWNLPTIGCAITGRRREGGARGMRGAPYYRRPCGSIPSRGMFCHTQYRPRVTIWCVKSYCVGSYRRSDCAHTILAHLALCRGKSSSRPVLSSSAPRSPHFAATPVALFPPLRVNTYRDCTSSRQLGRISVNLKRRHRPPRTADLSTLTRVRLECELIAENSKWHF